MFVIAHFFKRKEFSTRAPRDGLLCAKVESKESAKRSVMTSPQQETGLPSTFGNSISLVRTNCMVPSTDASTVVPMDDRGTLLKAYITDLHNGMAFIQPLANHGVWSFETQLMVVTKNRPGPWVVTFQWEPAGMFSSLILSYAILCQFDKSDDDLVLYLPLHMIL